MRRRVFVLQKYRKVRKSYAYPIGILRTKIFSGEAVSQPPLGPILGQYQINMAAFCEHFNEESITLFNDKVELRTFVRRIDFNNVVLDLRIPSISTLVFSLSPWRSRKRARINLRRLFDLVRIRASFFPELPFLAVAKSVFSTLSTYNHIRYGF
jgi:Ribosomal protein L11, N-terminal domain